MIDSRVVTVVPFNRWRQPHHHHWHASDERQPERRAAQTASSGPNQIAIIFLRLAEMLGLRGGISAFRGASSKCETVYLRDFTSDNSPFRLFGLFPSIWLYTGDDFRTAF
jgi:hypothetical protein